MTTLYVAGKMRGIPEFNFPAFFDAQWRLECAGFTVINPAEHDSEEGFEYAGLTGNEDLSEQGFDLREALAWDLEQIAKNADGIALTEGWETSLGVAAEVATAKALGKQVKTVEEWLSGPFKVGDKVRVQADAWYTMDGLRIDHTLRTYVDMEGVISHDIDTDRDYTVEFADLKTDFGFSVSECFNEDCLELVEEPSGSVARLYELATKMAGDFVSFADVEDVLPDGEVRVTSETGGQKGRKPAELATVDPLALLELAKVSGFGAQKYESFNYLKGYDWTLSANAAFRHLLAGLNGEDLDPESGLPHFAHFAWHGLALTSFYLRGIGTDDRVSAVLATYREENNA